MIDCKGRAGIILAALVAGSLLAVPGCGTSGPSSTDASRNAPTSPATSPADQAKLQATIQKAQAQAAAQQAAAAAHPRRTTRPPSN